MLEGSLQRAGDRLRVTVNLLRTRDGASLWSDSFDIRMADIFTVQDTVAQQLASRLRLQLDASQEAQLTKHYTSNPIAYEFYLKGAYNFDQRMRDPAQMIESTISFYKQAIEADPNFALAHAQLAYAYAVTGGVSGTNTAGLGGAREGGDQPRAGARPAARGNPPGALSASVQSNSKATREKPRFARRSWPTS